MEKHLVEFWAMPAKEVSQPGDNPHLVDCKSVEEAVALERKFHAVGWAARAVTLRETRHFPTAGQR
mgnify:CR=1 FL=1